MFPQTIFINLEERKDRLEHVTKELQKIGINEPYHQNAKKESNGAIGCTKSHILALEHAKQNKWPSVFICEDDIEFLQPELTIQSFDEFQKDSNNNKSKWEWDVLIIGGNNCPPYNIVTQHYCRVYNCQTTTGYIVNEHYYDVLLENFRESVKQLEKEPHNGRLYALDIYWKRLQQKDSWYMLLPLCVTQYSNYSDIEKKETNYTWLMLDMEKKWLK